MIVSQFTGDLLGASDCPKGFEKLLKLALPQSKLMFDDVLVKHPNVTACIVVGAIACQ
jgi:hypothetical protein